MALVRYIKSAAHIPVGDKYVLVQRGAENKSIRHTRGHIVVVASAPSTIFQEAFAAAIDQAKKVADKESISTVFVIDRRRGERSKLER